MVAHFQIIFVVFSLKLIPTGAYSGLSLSAMRICYTLCACALFGCVPQCRAYHACKCATFLHASDWFMHGYIFRSINISTLVQLSQQLAWSCMLSTSRLCSHQDTAHQCASAHARLATSSGCLNKNSRQRCRRVQVKAGAADCHRKHHLSNAKGIWIRKD
jgi:hypothetical protein